ncbi:MAG: hypothetical protein WCK35_25660 [Chloroflexota bacterium]
MLKSILRTLGRIALILLASGVVIGIAYGFSLMGNGNQNFRPDGERSFEQGSNTTQNGQNTRPPRRHEGGEEGFRENGSVGRGLIQLTTNSLMIAIFTWVGLLIFRRFKRRLPANLDLQADS